VSHVGGRMSRLNGGVGTLEGYRVLELSGELAYFASKIPG